MAQLTFPLTHRDIWNMRNAEAPTYCYGIYDGPHLIYVGIARDVDQRLSQHRGDKEWWDDDLVVAATRYPTRQRAARVEQWLINKSTPRYNTVAPGPRSLLRRGA